MTFGGALIIFVRDFQTCLKIVLAPSQNEGGASSENLDHALKALQYNEEKTMTW